MKRFFGLCLLLSVMARPSLATRIAVFDEARAGQSAYAVSTIYTQIRASILANFPGTSFIEVNTLTPAGIASADVLMISSVSFGHDAVPPLTPSEQAAMTAFVAAGGMAILVTDNATFAPDAHASNQSMLNPFGLTSDFVNIGETGVTVVHFANPITTGPYGTITSTAYSYAGAFVQVPSTFTVLANVDALNGPGIAFAPKGALGAGHGAVVAFSDCSFHTNDWSPAGQNLILNCLAYGLPTPSLPTAYTILEGEEFEGGVERLFAGDDTYVSAFNDPDSLRCVIEILGNVNNASPSHLGVLFEQQVGRPGLAFAVKQFNYSLGSFQAIGGSVAPTTDTVQEIVLTNNPANYIRSSDKQVRTRLELGPINDEDPAQDGWLHSWDQVTWTTP